ncbi:MAG TPA: hydroxymethylglutaryl-CoA reductase, degradative [Rectinemataceae bacterium]|nr:hydroxymethylglutaryl-CoA reductase, degradative [Rectinemataceae bacterium]
MKTDDKRSAFPEDFRRRDLQQRRELVLARLGPDPDERSCSLPDGSPSELADVMVESAIGVVPLPLGVACGFRIDGLRVDIPMAVEEPSVVAAASFAGRLVAKGGGFSTRAMEPVMSAQVYLSGVAEAGYSALQAAGREVAATLAPMLAGLDRRGGGFRGYRCARIAGPALVRAEIDVDVRDAMGANILNSAAEALRPLLETLSGGRALMCILTNAALERRAAASFSLTLAELGRACPPGWEGPECADRIVLASQLAAADPLRAVTHNKGIMNGIASLALATMNDYRAIEAAAHAWAARDGSYRGLGSYRVEGDCLCGELELPLPFATVGGALSLHPSAHLALRMLGNPDATGLARIAAALGLAQNLAALLALVTTGIQSGHMRLHAARLAYMAGARGAAVRRVAGIMAARGSLSPSDAEAILAELAEEEPVP